MYNIIKQNNIMHNNYHYKIINDTTGEILKEDTIYNQADGSIYIADIKNNTTLTTTFSIEYKSKKYNPNTGEEEYEEKSTLYNTGVNFFRNTPDVEIDFNKPIAFSCDLSLPATSNFVGRIERFLLGTPINITDESGQVIDIKSWSEAEVSIEKTQSTRLELSIIIYITVSSPSPVDLKLYDKSISSILNIKNGCFPTPGPQKLSLSTLDINDLPSPMKKLIPTIVDLPLISKTEYEPVGKFSLINPVNAENEQFYIPGVGSIDKYGNAVDFNIGSAYSIVYSDIGASALGNSTVEQQEPILIPIIKFNRQLLTELIENNPDINDKIFYYFASVPQHCVFSNCYINGVQSGAEVFFIDPSIIRDSAPRPEYVGMAEDEKVSISEYRSAGDNLLPGTHYAHYIYGGYWEPPEGTPVSPKYLYFSGGNHINNIFIGDNIKCVIQGKIDNTWETILTGVPRTLVKTDKDTTIYEEFRAVVTAPSSNSTNFYVAQLESSVIQKKSYDPNVLCIGNSVADFGQAGIAIKGSQIVAWNTAISQESNVSGYTVSIGIIPQSYYKAANSLTYLKYGIIVQ